MAQSIHSLVRKHREHAGLSLRDLAKASGVSLAKLSCVESGEQDLGRITLRAISQALHLRSAQVVELVFARRRRAA